ncbi:hypothetical protein CC1G_15393 [Coprinopsis cinerea okayama7|uniref:Uncharacterized protein n=1 Tax=Coprinopsis cinerea (strain Okayama-7 / 130 / ATCC MYA-4618 / FGSC 9003) TaxID=240176 RepID=D6RQS3_COPC7|nr:hypothetical protein CC1G_15393 [Coprinopsis cinerea okayama7\|eukprot:XP_002910115.1 hypothetical protein CC1G_15393 [Coprinopsis cinerea okayama7\
MKPQEEKPSSASRLGGGRRESGSCAPRHTACMMLGRPSVLLLAIIKARLSTTQLLTQTALWQQESFLSKAVVDMAVGGKKAWLALRDVTYQDGSTATTLIHPTPITNTQEGGWRVQASSWVQACGEFQGMIFGQISNCGNGRSETDKELKSPILVLQHHNYRLGFIVGIRTSPKPKLHHRTQGTTNVHDIDHFNSIQNSADIASTHSEVQVR